MAVTMASFKSPLASLNLRLSTMAPKLRELAN